LFGQRYSPRGQSMNVSQINQEAMPIALGATYLAFLTALAPEVVLGAFTGSVIFLLGSTNKPKWQWVLYFMVAFLTGLLGAHTVASIATGTLSILHIKTLVPVGFGALLSAACTINLLDWLRDNPAFFWTRKTGGQA
jgi:hypothetical protein